MRYFNIALYLKVLIPLLFIDCQLSGQFPVNYQYTILSKQYSDLIIAESSGDLAMQHIINLAPYSRPRNPAELAGPLNESSYIMKKLREYGLQSAKLENVGKTTAWFGEEGSLWEVAPGLSKIADYRDVPEMLVEGSQTSDVSAQLLWIGDGGRDFFQNGAAKAKGKIVVTGSSPWSVHLQAMNAGAVGTVSFYSPRPYTDPLQIPNLSIPSRGFAFLLPPREGILLRDRLQQGEKIEVKAKVLAGSSSVNLEVSQCLIEGSDTAAPEIIFTAHLFEGYVKMGANDNMSGAAVILEVARVLNKLISSGQLPKPVRTIRFLWVPEFSGTIPWVNRHLETARNALCNINLDMVGLNLRQNGSFLHLHRSGFSTASFTNDVIESYYRYVGETNVEGITDRLGRRGFSNRIVSPSGTDDPFYFRISTLHGSSDNAVFNDWGIKVPGMKMITWPDKYYHSSEDNPDKCDPTQLRRVVFIAAAGAYTLAAAGETEAQRILAESYAAALLRSGAFMTRSADMIWKAEKETVEGAYKRAVFNMEGLLLAEKDALSKTVRISNTPAVTAQLRSAGNSLDRLLEQNLIMLKEAMVARCKLLGLPEIQLRLAVDEKEAMSIVPEPTVLATKMGYGGDQKYLAKVPAETSGKYPLSGIVNTDEAAGLANGKRNLLQIKKMLDAQFETETPLKSLINYYYLLREAGLMKF